MFYSSRRVMCTPTQRSEATVTLVERQDWFWETEDEAFRPLWGGFKRTVPRLLHSVYS